MHRMIALVFALSAFGIGTQEYTMVTEQREVYHPAFFEISEDGVSHRPSCRCYTVGFGVGQRTGFKISVDHLAGFGNLLLFQLEVPEPVSVHRFDVTSRWSRFENNETGISFPLRVDERRRFSIGLVGYLSPDFHAGNTFKTRMEVSLLSDNLGAIHVIELSGILLERNGSRPYTLKEVQPEKTGEMPGPIEFSRVIAGGPCQATAVGVTARMLEPGTLIVRLDVHPAAELLGFKVLGRRANPDGFRALVSVLDSSVNTALPAQLYGLNDLYYRLKPDPSSDSPWSNEEEFEVEMQIGNCYSAKERSRERSETLRYMARPMK